MKTIEWHARRIAISVVQGYEEMQKGNQTEFTRIASRAVEQALNSICANIQDDTQREIMQKKVYESSKYSIKYSDMGPIPCGENQFYNYRRDLIRRVAENLGLINKRSNEHK